MARELDLADDFLKNAVPLSEALKMPSSTERYRALEGEIAKTSPSLEQARRKSDALKAETANLRQRLIATAADVQSFEIEKAKLGSEITSLAAEEHRSEEGFAHDRVAVARLLAVLERLQQDMPPVMALKPDDALAASRGAMMLGAELPRLYRAAADLVRRVRYLSQTREELAVRRSQADRNQISLATARSDLDQLLAMKTQEADEASARYGDLAAQFEVAAGEAATLGGLLSKVSALRAQHPMQGVTVVAPPSAGPALHRGSLLAPVAGSARRGDSDSPAVGRDSGISFLAPAGAPVVAPTDCQVIFAGPYHKSGQVLILESTGGYDLVLAGLERVDVRTGDALLVGEPLGTMPSTGAGSRLYFELRQNGKGVNPAPWLGFDLRKAKRT